MTRYLLATLRRFARAIVPALCVLVAGPALAEPEEYRVSIHPSIRVTTNADDNVDLEENGDGDIGFFFFPRVELGLQGRWLHVGADLGADVRQYVQDSSPSDVFLRFGGFAEVGVEPGLSVRISDAYAPTPVELGRPLDHAANLVQTNRFAASVRLWQELPNESELSLVVQATRLTSESFSADVGGGVVDDDFHADFWEGSFLSEFHVPLSDTISGFARASTRFRSFDDSSASDFGDLALLFGVSTQWWGNVDFDAAIGYGRIAFEDGGKNRFIGEAKLRYRISDGTTLRFAFDQRNTADIAGNDFTETTGRIDLERRFGERTAASVAVFLTRTNNESWKAGANLFGGVEARVRRQITRRTQLELMARHWSNAGDYSSDDFNQNQISLIFSYRR
jgi:hypothetical protein